MELRHCILNDKVEVQILREVKEILECMIKDTALRTALANLFIDVDLE